MTQNISGFGVVINVRSDITFPLGGIPVTQVADDIDPLDIQSVQIADTAMGVNGDLLVWYKAQKLPLVISVIADSEDDRNLQILADANRAAQGKTVANDAITIVVAYPNGKVVTLSGGVITDAQFGISVTSQGRFKTKTYSFIFQNKS